MSCFELLALISSTDFIAYSIGARARAHAWPGTRDCPIFPLQHMGYHATTKTGHVGRCTQDSMLRTHDADVPWTRTTVHATDFR